MLQLGQLQHLLWDALVGARLQGDPFQLTGEPDGRCLQPVMLVGALQSTLAFIEGLTATIKVLRSLESNKVHVTDRPVAPSL